MNDDAEKAPTRLLLSRFDADHRAKFGVPAYIVGGKHAKMLADVWKVYGTERTEQLIDVFFEGNDFANDCGYSVEVFRSQVPRTLMLIIKREDPSAAQPQISDHEFFRRHGYSRSRLA